MKQLIIYDLDGTLVDTKQDIASAANYMLREMNRPTLAVLEISCYVGLGLDQLIKGCLKTDDSACIEQGRSLYRAYYAKHLLDSSLLYPGVRELLEHFKLRKQAVLTNKPNPFSRDILKGLGVLDYFCELVAGDCAYPKKPNPTAVCAIMDKLGVQAKDAVLCGDSPIDVATGRNAGVFTAGIAQGFASYDELAASSPGVLVRSFDELLLVAKQEGW